jgi:phenylpropionate dioxygenase-like ring-hydroxylating dioxygenase large terminal subunit
MSTERPIVRPDYVPATGYISDEILALEKAKLWPRVWLIAAREEQFRTRGDFVKFDIADESILMVRDDNGTLRAFYNVCQHRGRQLKEANHGNLGAQIVCPFHAWRYRLDGELAFVKDEEDWKSTSTFCKADLNLKALRLATWGGWVWVTMDPTIEPLLDYLAPVPDLFRNFEFENTRIGWFKTVVAHCNWKVGMDAFNEAYHAEGTHPQLNKYGVGKQRVPGVPSGRHSALKVRRNDTSSAGGLLNQAKVDLRHHMYNLGKELFGSIHALYTEHFVNAAERLTTEVAADAQAADVMSAFKRFHREEMEKAGARWPESLDDAQINDAGGTYIIFPNTILLAAYDGALWYRFRPHADDPDYCYFDIWWLGRYAPGKEPPFEHELFLNEREFVGQNPFLEQDFGNMQWVQKGMKSRGFRGGRTNPVQERAVSHLHDVVFDYLYDDGAKWQLKK